MILKKCVITDARQDVLIGRSGALVEQCKAFVRFDHTKPFFQHKNLFCVHSTQALFEVEVLIA